MVGLINYTSEPGLFRIIMNGTLRSILEHINSVRTSLEEIVAELDMRANLHDLSKTRSPELEGFVTVSEKLRDLEYGSPEYEQSLKELGPILDHHYKHNPHHPEHHVHGIEDMTLIDIIEMFADWRAASLNTKDGSLQKSLAINKTRFKIDNQLYLIFENTRKALKW